MKSSGHEHQGCCLCRRDFLRGVCGERLLLHPSPYSPFIASCVGLPLNFPAIPRRPGIRLHLLPSTSRLADPAARLFLEIPPMYKQIRNLKPGDQFLLSLEITLGVTAPPKSVDEETSRVPVHIVQAPFDLQDTDLDFTLTVPTRSRVRFEGNPAEIDERIRSLEALKERLSNHNLPAAEASANRSPAPGDGDRAADGSAASSSARSSEEAGS
mgnify:CR=1 FL=1